MPTMNDTIAKITKLPDGRKLEFYFSNASKKWQLWEIDGDKSRKVNESGSKDSVVKYASDNYRVQLKAMNTGMVSGIIKTGDGKKHYFITLGDTEDRFIQLDSGQLDKSLVDWDTAIVYHESPANSGKYVTIPGETEQLQKTWNLGKKSVKESTGVQLKSTNPIVDAVAYVFQNAPTAIPREGVKRAIEFANTEVDIKTLKKRVTCYSKRI